MSSTYPKSFFSLDTSVDYYEEVVEMHREAQIYLSSFKWCEKISNSYLYYNLGSTLCVFLFEIKNHQSEDDNKIWVVAGDLPKMYLDSFGAKSVKDVLEDYADLAGEWADHILSGKSLVNCFPFNERPGIELANLLKTRVEFIKNNLLQNIADIKLED